MPQFAHWPTLDSMTPEEAVRGIAGHRGSDQDGIRRLVVVLDAVAEGLAEPPSVAAFFATFAAEWTRDPTARWFDVWAWVCRGITAPTTVAPGYLRSARTPPGVAPARLPATVTTSVSETVWRSHHLRPQTEHLSHIGFKFPEFPLARDAKAKEHLEALLLQDWFRSPTHASGAWLGRPAEQAANCWVTTQQVSPTEPPEPWPTGARSASAAIGVTVPSRLGSAFRYWLDGGKLTSNGHGSGNRPSFADLGSGWFRIRASGARAKGHAKHGWGSTAHLDAIGHAHLDNTGLPERVLSSVPLDSSAVLRVELLLPDTPAVTAPKPSQKKFDAMLKQGRKPAQIVEQVVALLASP